MIMEAVKRNVCRGVIFLMACLTCVVVFGSGLIAKATNYSPYAPYTTYTGSLGIYGSKTLTGREFQAGDEFTFKIVADSNNPTVVEGAGELLKEVTIQPTEEQKQFDFGAELTFDEPGKYIYYISEVKPKESLANIIYDQTIYRLTVNVEVDEEDDTGNVPGGQGGSDGKAEAQTGSETSDSDRMEGDSMADESNGGITGPTSPAFSSILTAAPHDICAAVCGDIQSGAVTAAGIFSRSGSWGLFFAGFGSIVPGRTGRTGNSAV